jgi:hypothetical protein
MKLLLDEQIDVRLKTALAELDVYTLVDMGWQGLKNGVLSERINEGAFAFFITADKNLPFQQNLDKLLFTLILLDTPTLLWEHQSLFVPKIRAYVTEFSSTPLFKIVHIGLEGFSKGKKREQFRRVFPPEQILFI